MDLQLTWYIIIALLLTVYAVVDGVDLGIGTLYPFIARNGGQKELLRTSSGPLWNGNEVWLLAGAGALVGAFPPVFTTLMSGFGPAVLLVLFGLIVRAVAVELRRRDPARRALWDALFFLGSAIPALLFGIALGNVVLGIPLDADGDYAGTVGDLLNPFALSVGFTGLLLFLLQGAAWASIRIEGQLRVKALATRSVVHRMVVVALAALTVYSVFIVPERVRNVLDRPAGWLGLLFLIVGVGAARYAMGRRRDVATLAAVSASIVGLMTIAAVGNFPEMVPARDTPAATGLTVYDSSSSDHTLTVMAVVAAIGCPVVLAYTVWVFRAFHGKVKPEAARTE